MMPRHCANNCDPGTPVVLQRVPADRQQEGVRPLDTAMDVYRPESWRLGQHRLGCLESLLESLLAAVGYPQLGCLHDQCNRLRRVADP
jgi:hypothetical protein